MFSLAIVSLFYGTLGFSQENESTTALAVVESKEIQQGDEIKEENKPSKNIYRVFPNGSARAAFMGVLKEVWEELYPQSSLIDEIDDININGEEVIDVSEASSGLDRTRLLMEKRAQKFARQKSQKERASEESERIANKLKFLAHYSTLLSGDKKSSDDGKQAFVGSDDKAVESFKFFKKNYWYPVVLEGEFPNVRDTHKADVDIALHMVFTSLRFLYEGPDSASLKQLENSINTHYEERSIQHAFLKSIPKSENEALALLEVGILSLVKLSDEIPKLNEERASSFLMRNPMEIAGAVMGYGFYAAGAGTVGVALGLLAMKAAFASFVISNTPRFLVKVNEVRRARGEEPIFKNLDRYFAYRMKAKGRRGLFSRLLNPFGSIQKELPQSSKTQLLALPQGQTIDYLNESYQLLTLALRAIAAEHNALRRDEKEIEVIDLRSGLLEVMGCDTLFRAAFKIPSLTQ
tara:strand:+ start:2443 stop:3834 length:1392 start_codon:yes stop_codon:yes gene_type:complete